MSYPLRLAPELDAEARERCQRLGISLNAFIAVALDAYMRADPAIRGSESGQRARSGVAGGKRRGPAGDRYEKAQRKPGEAFEGDGAGDGVDWRFFHRDPELWPYVDPDFAHAWEGVDQEDETACAAVEAEYWLTRERPSGK